MAAESAAYARASIAKGSKSFAAASRLLPPAVRDDVARLYAWCRHADDVIDGQTLGHGETLVADPAERLADLTARTDAALAGAATGNPIFDGFGHVARAHGITAPLAHDHLAGFAMDVDGRTYDTLDGLFAYCYGVAGVVGVMMALTLGVRPADTDTLDRACDLGIAFQLTNISRDIIADAAIGRVYLPTTLLRAEGVPPTPEAVRDPAHAPAVFRVAEALLDAADRYYASAEVGIRRLPMRTAWSIASARAVYRAIGSRRRAAGPAGLALRVGTGKTAKLALVALSALSAARSDGRHRPRPALWTRPRHEA